jgi:hypothetical protein
LLGVGVGELVPANQLELFAASAASAGPELDGAVDRIHEKFGGESLVRASQLPAQERGH